MNRETGGAAAVTPEFLPIVQRWGGARISAFTGTEAGGATDASSMTTLLNDGTVSTHVGNPASASLTASSDVIAETLLGDA